MGVIKMNNVERLNNLVIKILEIAARELIDSKKVADIPNWNSFNNLLIISSVEEEFKIQFTTEEIIKVVTYGDIKQLLRKHGVQIE